MKRIAVALFITIITCLFATADDVVKVLRVYSGGEYTTIPLSCIDSLAHSKYDVYGILHDDTISSVIHAIDRKYQIPVDLIDSIVVGECDMQQYEMQIDEVQKFIDEQTDLEINTFQTNLQTWLNSREFVLSTSINENKNLITVKFKNGLSLYIDFQDASFFSDVEDEELPSVRMSSYRNKGDIYDVSYKEGEEIIQKKNILYVKATHMNLKIWGIFDIANNADEERGNIEKNIEESPVDLNPLVYIDDLTFMGYNWSNYAMVILAQTHGVGKGAFQVDTNNESKIRVNRAITQYHYNGAIQKFSYGDDDNKYYKYIVNNEAILSKLNYSNSIFLGNYCWSYELAQNKNGGKYTIIGNTSLTGYKNNVEVSNTITKNLFSGIILSDAVKGAPSGIVGPVFSNNLSLSRRGNQRYFSIFMDEIREQSENGNPIIRGAINGYDNLKKDQLNYVAFCHEGPDDFTPDDDDVIKIEIPKDKIKSNGTFEFEFQSDEPLKSAIVYGFVFGFEYKGKTFYGETKLSGKFDGLEYEKLDELCYIESGEHFVLYNYELKTNFEITEHQKEYKIGLYLKDELMAIIPIKVEKGSNEQTTQFDFGCTKEDYEFDYANYRAEVKDLSFKAISTVTIDGKQAVMVFSHPNEKVDFEVTYEQKPDVRFATAQVGDAVFEDGDAYVGYAVEATTTGTLFMNSIKLIVDGDGWFGGYHDAINDLIYDNGYIYDEGAFRIRNYEDLEEPEKVSSVIGYYEITESGTNVKRSGSNHVKFTTSNGKYITGAVIQEGAGARNQVMNDGDGYMAIDTGDIGNDDVDYHASRRLKAKSKMLERWKYALKIRSEKK